jgi:hypothetical protein
LINAHEQRISTEKTAAASCNDRPFRIIAAWLAAIWSSDGSGIGGFHFLGKNAAVPAWPPMDGRLRSAIIDPPGDCPSEARGQMQNRWQARAKVFVREQRSNRRGAMMDGVDEILQNFEKAVAAASAEAVSRMRAISARQPEVVGKDPPPYRNAAEAFGEFFPFNDQKVRRICRENAVNMPTGHRFAQQIEGKWYVIAAEFAAYVERIKRGEPTG